VWKYFALFGFSEYCVQSIYFSRAFQKKKVRDHNIYEKTIKKQWHILGMLKTMAHIRNADDKETMAHIRNVVS